jgi:hypothetical protein
VGAAMDAGAIAVMFAEGDAEERERSYAAVEAVVFGAPPAGSGRGEAVAFTAACVKPLIASVLCAPAVKVGEEEYRRASLLLYEMCKLDLLVVSAEAFRKNDEGAETSCFALPFCTENGPKTGSWIG